MQLCKVKTKDMLSENFKFEGNFETSSGKKYGVYADPFNSAAVAAKVEDESKYLLSKEDLLEMSKKANSFTVGYVVLITNYGVELHSKESSRDFGFYSILKMQL